MELSEILVSRFAVIPNECEGSRKDFSLEFTLSIVEGVEMTQDDVKETICPNSRITIFGAS
jgi:hypothetical protein